MSGIPSLPLSSYRTLPEEHYGESLAFPVDDVAWNPYPYYPPYYGYGTYSYPYFDYNSYLYHLQRIDRQNKLDEYDEMLRNKSTQELKKIQELRDKIDTMSKKAKEKQLETEAELQNHQTLNKQMINQMTMLRENEFLRERIAQREFDKIDYATNKIQEKADSLSRFKDHLHSVYPPYPAYYPPAAYMTPRIETTKIIETDSCCRKPCHTSRCCCEGVCDCGDESYIYLLPPIHSSRGRNYSGSKEKKRQFRNKSVKPHIDIEHF